MNNKSIILIVVLALIVGSIIYLESTKPEVDTTNVDSEIKVNETQKTLSQEDINRIQEKERKYQRANELVDPEGYINVDNITISENIGKKVILVDFWTYSCINCQRTLPYLTSWDQKYKDDGLLIIGVHTPEFEFEKDYENVLQAVDKWGIEYPVVQDNDRQTWRAYKNRYWPRKYIIDIDGFIVYDHIGEGAYEETEKIIQDLLKERNDVLNVENDIADDTVIFETDKGDRSGRTPEIYFGYKFSREQFGNEKSWVPNEEVEYTSPDNKLKNLFYLDGKWKNNEDNMELVGEEGVISLVYFAKNVHFVAGSDQPTDIEIYLDGEKVNDLVVEKFDTYDLISLEESGEHYLEIRSKKGLMAYTFTFG